MWANARGPRNPRPARRGSAAARPGADITRRPGLKAQHASARNLEVNGASFTRVRTGAVAQGQVDLRPTGFFQLLVPGLRSKGAGGIPVRNGVRRRRNAPGRSGAVRYPLVWSAYWLVSSCGRRQAREHDCPLQQAPQAVVAAAPPGPSPWRHCAEPAAGGARPRQLPGGCRSPSHPARGPGRAARHSDATGRAAVCAQRFPGEGRPVRCGCFRAPRRSLLTRAPDRQPSAGRESRQAARRMRSAVPGAGMSSTAGAGNH